MRYVITQQRICIGDDFAIKDEHGREVSYVDGKAMSFGKKLLILDKNKKKVAMLRQKLGTINPTYKLTREGAEPTIIKKSRFSMRHKFTVDVPGPRDYTVLGDFLGHEYSFYRDGDQVARVSKKLLSTTDAYAVDIERGDRGAILATVIVIDLVLHNGKKGD